MDAEREKVWFASGGTECAGWHYAGSNGGCVIMAAGFAVTKEPATDRFARRFHDAGFSVLAFDYRESARTVDSRARSSASGTSSPTGQAAITFAADSLAAARNAASTRHPGQSSAPSRGHRNASR